MRKWLIIAVIALLLIAGAVVCGILLFGSDFYEQTQERLELPAKQITLTTRVGEGEERLSGSYTVSLAGGRAEISYTFEELALFEMQNGVYVAPSARKVTQKGNMSVENGTVLEANGKQPPLPVPIITLSGLAFEERCFENAVITETTFAGDVKDAGALLGLSADCKNVHLSLVFDEEYVRTVEVTYDTAQGNAAVLQYTLEY